MGERVIYADTARSAQIVLCDLCDSGRCYALNPNISRHAVTMLRPGRGVFESGVIFLASVSTVNVHRFTGKIPDVFKQSQKPLVNLYNVAGVVLGMEFPNTKVRGEPLFCGAFV
jgi:hypothetical protein